MAVWLDDRLLLVRQSYQPRPAFPGGGVKPGETPLDAARRELREELGLRPEPAALRHAYVTTQRWDGRLDTVTFFEWHVRTAPVLRPDRREVIAAAFFAPAQLPAVLAAPVAHYLAWRTRLPRAAGCE